MRATIVWSCVRFADMWIAAGGREIASMPADPRRLAGGAGRRKSEPAALGDYCGGFRAGPVASGAEVPGGGDGSRPVGHYVQLAEQVADDPGDVVLGAVAVPADDVDLPAGPAQDPLELIEVQGGAGRLRPHFESAFNRRQDDPSVGVLSDRLVAAEPTPGSERVECSQPFITVPAARICGRDIASRGKPEPGGLLHTALARVLRSDAKVSGAFRLQESDRREQELGVPPRPLHLGLEVGPARVEADRLSQLDARAKRVKPVAGGQGRIANPPCLATEPHPEMVWESPADTTDSFRAPSPLISARERESAVPARPRQRTGQPARRDMDEPPVALGYRSIRRLLARRMSAPPPPSVTAAGVPPVPDGAAMVSIPAPG